MMRGNASGCCVVVDSDNWLNGREGRIFVDGSAFV